jgi:hypothetical protein
MKLAGQVALFRLSRAGREDLDGLVPENGTFESHVFEEDEHGLWVYLPEEQADMKRVGPLMLLKWEYIATLTLLYSTSI